MLYFSATFMVPIRVLVSVSQRATSSPMDMDFASSSVAERVIGMGQKRSCLLGSANLSQQFFQSSFPIKPSSGVKAPIPIMIRSLVSRLVMGTFFRPPALWVSSFLSCPLRSSGFSSGLPWGGTSRLMLDLLSVWTYSVFRPGVYLTSLALAGGSTTKRPASARRR